MRHGGTRGGGGHTHGRPRGGDGETQRRGETRSHTEARGETVTHGGTREETGHTRRHKIKRDSTLIRNCARQDTMECI